MCWCRLLNNILNIINMGNCCTNEEFEGCEICNKTIEDIEIISINNVFYLFCSVKCKQLFINKI